jgi:hypothetical protein
MEPYQAKRRSSLELQAKLQQPPATGELNRFNLGIYVADIKAHPVTNLHIGEHL